MALRYDAIEDVGAYVRAPEPATLYRMHGSLSGAYRVRNVAARNRVVLTNRCPTGLNRGFGGPQVYFALERAMAIAGGDSVSIRPSSLDAISSGKTSFPTAHHRAVSTTPATTRPVWSDLSSSPATTIGATSRRRRARPAGSSASGLRAWSSLRSRTWATSRLRRPQLNGRRRCRSPGMRRAPPSASIRSAGSPSAWRRRRRDRATGPLPRRWSATSWAWIRPTSTSSPSWTRARMRGRSPRATTRLDSRASGPARCCARPRRWRRS